MARATMASPVLAPLAWVRTRLPPQPVDVIQAETSHLASQCGQRNSLPLPVGQQDFLLTQLLKKPSPFSCRNLLQKDGAQERTPEHDPSFVLIRHGWHSFSPQFGESTSLGRPRKLSRQERSSITVSAQMRSCGGIQLAASLNKTTRLSSVLVASADQESVICSPFAIITPPDVVEVLEEVDLPDLLASASGVLFEELVPFPEMP